ncbi:MAG: hypothetical protein V2I34_01110 [Bacteroidales bacterium]|jgi:hypothetical protein|nr:hypothetical protein [Bacteroidales bacterium]
MKKIALMLFCITILSSCEKVEQLIVENADIPLISKVLIDGVSYYEYTYNDANLLNEEKSKFHYTKHNYSDNNLLSTSEFYVDPGMFSSNSRVVQASMNRTEWVNPDNSAKSLTQSFDYNSDGLLARKTYTRPSVTDSEYSEFTFENNRISRQTMYWQDVMSFFIEYEYDENGNVTKESKYYVSSGGIAELWTTTEYEFDDMHNPFLAFKRLMSPGKYTNPNNITKETYTIYFEVDQWTQKVQITNNTYEYNSKGYPTKVNGETEYVYK